MTYLILTATWKNNFRFELDFTGQSMLSDVIPSLTAILCVQTLPWVYGTLLQTRNLDQMRIRAQNPPALLIAFKS